MGMGIFFGMYNKLASPKKGYMYVIRQDSFPIEAIINHLSQPHRVPHIILCSIRGLDVPSILMF